MEQKSYITVNLNDMVPTNPICFQFLVPPLQGDTGMKPAERMNRTPKGACTSFVFLHPLITPH